MVPVSDGQLSSTQVQQQVAALYELDAAKAQEVAQDAFVRLFTNLRDGASIEDAKSWVYRVAHNLGINSLSRSGSAFPVAMNAVAPGFFQSTSSYVSALHANGTVVAPVGAIPGVTSSPAAPGETIELFGTGFGPTTPSEPSGQMVHTAAALADTVPVTIGGVPVTVTYAGVTGIGLFQVNVTVPANLAPGDAAIQATVDGASTQKGVFVNVGK